MVKSVLDPLGSSVCDVIPLEFKAHLFTYSEQTPGEVREGRPTPFQVHWKSFLSLLWRCVVKPVLDALGFSVRDVIFLEFEAHLSGTDTWGSILHFLVSDRTIHVSSYTCGRSL